MPTHPETLHFVYTEHSECVQGDTIIKKVVFSDNLMVFDYFPLVATISAPGPICTPSTGPTVAR